jgi:hypothetical protein
MLRPAAVGCRSGAGGGGPSVQAVSPAVVQHVLAAATWSGATRTSDTNPAGLMDVNLGYGRQLSKRWSAYSSVQWERACGVASQYSLFEGVELQTNERFALDLAGQHYALNTATHDHQIVLGITYTLFRHK